MFLKNKFLTSEDLLNNINKWCKSKSIVANLIENNPTGKKTFSNLKIVSKNIEKDHKLIYFERKKEIKIYWNGHIFDNLYNFYRRYSNNEPISLPRKVNENSSKKVYIFINKDSYFLNYLESKYHNNKNIELVVDLPASKKLLSVQKYLRNQDECFVIQIYNDQINFLNFKNNEINFVNDKKIEKIIISVFDFNNYQIEFGYARSGYYNFRNKHDPIGTITVSYNDFVYNDKFNLTTLDKIDIFINYLRILIDNPQVDVINSVVKNKYSNLLEFESKKNHISIHRNDNTKNIALKIEDHARSTWKGVKKFIEDQDVLILKAQSEMSRAVIIYDKVLNSIDIKIVSTAKRRVTCSDINDNFITLFRNGVPKIISLSNSINLISFRNIFILLALCLSAVLAIGFFSNIDFNTEEFTKLWNFRNTGQLFFVFLVSFGWIAFEAVVYTAWGEVLYKNKIRFRDNLRLAMLLSIASFATPYGLGFFPIFFAFHKRRNVNITEMLAMILISGVGIQLSKVIMIALLVFDGWQLLSGYRFFTVIFVILVVWNIIFGLLYLIPFWSKLQYPIKGIFKLLPFNTTFIKNINQDVENHFEKSDLLLKNIFRAKGVFLLMTLIYLIRTMLSVSLTFTLATAIIDHSYVLNFNFFMKAAAANFFTSVIVDILPASGGIGSFEWIHSTIMDNYLVKIGVPAANAKQIANSLTVFVRAATYIVLASNVFIAICVYSYKSFFVKRNSNLKKNYQLKQ